MLTNLVYFDLIWIMEDLFLMPRMLIYVKYAIKTWKWILNYLDLTLTINFMLIRLRC